MKEAKIIQFFKLKISELTEIYYAVRTECDLMLLKNS